MISPLNKSTIEFKKAEIGRKYFSFKIMPKDPEILCSVAFICAWKFNWGCIRTSRYLTMLE